MNKDNKKTRENFNSVLEAFRIRQNELAEYIGCSDSSLCKALRTLNSGKASELIDQAIEYIREINEELYGGDLANALKQAMENLAISIMSVPEEEE